MAIHMRPREIRPWACNLSSLETSLMTGSMGTAESQRRGAEGNYQQVNPWIFHDEADGGGRAWEGGERGGA